MSVAAGGSLGRGDPNILTFPSEHEKLELSSGLSTNGRLPGLSANHSLGGHRTIELKSCWIQFTLMEAQEERRCD